MTTEVPQTPGEAPEPADQLRQFAEISVRSFATVNTMIDGAQILTETMSYSEADPGLHIKALAEASRAKNRLHAVELHHAYLAAQSSEYHYADRHGMICTAAEDLGLVLGISATQMKHFIKRGTTFFDHLPILVEALNEGRISPDKVTMITNKLCDLPAPITFEVEQQIIDVVDVMSCSELRHLIDKILIEIDPDDADDRHARAAASRRVTRPQRGNDGISFIRIAMPDEQAASFDTALEAAVNAAIKAGDCRSRSQLRADILASWAIFAMREGWTFTTDCGEPVEVPPTKINVTIPFEVLLRALPGFTPPPSYAEAFVHDVFGDDDEDDLEASPAVTTTPTSPTRLEGSDPPTQGAAPALIAAPPSPPPPPEPESWTSSPIRPVSGLTQAAWIEGYGYISPTLALILAQGGQWRRIVTDTLTGAPLDIGRERYRPPAAITAAVRTRDRMCRRPGCARAAAHCEIDHVKAFSEGGTTSVSNLWLLCGRCHRTKTMGAARILEVNDDGTRTWETKSGTFTIPAAPRRKHHHLELSELTQAQAREKLAEYDPDAPIPF